MNYSDWKEITVDVSDVLLDYDNPRVFIDSPTQENLLRFLVDQDNAIELAIQININSGLPLAEKPVLTIENGKYIMLEGNRRLSACKILLNPQLLSEKEANRIPKIDTQMERYLKNFPVVLAPDRDSTEAFITLRHSGDKSVKRWSTIAATKRFVNRYRKEESINHIARVLNEKPADVRRGIRFFFFLEFVRNEIEWTEDEKRKLEIYKLETTKLDRFLPFSRKATDILKIKFATDQSITTVLPIEKFKTALKVIITRVYLENEIDTRTNMDDVFNSEIIEICNLTQINDSNSGTGTPEEETEQEPEHETGTTEEETEQEPEDETGITGEESKQEPEGETGTTEETEQEPEDETGTTENETEQKPEDEIGTTEEETEEGSGEGTGTKEEEPEDTGSSNGGTRTSGGRRLATEVEKYEYLTSAYSFKNRYQKNNRINTLMRELRNTKYKEKRMGAMYLIRSLLETYTHEYINHFVIIESGEYRMKGVARDRTKRNQKLRELLFDQIKIHLKQAYPSFEEEIELLEVTFTENNNTSATRIINFYIHSQTQVPDFHELLDAWKKVSKILNCLDEILYQRMS